MRRVFLTLLLAGLHGQALADWVLVGGDQANTFRHYSDSSTIRRVGSRVRMWSLFDFEASQATLGLLYRSIKADVEYDCIERKTRTRHKSYFSGNMGGGTEVDDTDFTGEWDDVDPDSVSENMFENACGKALAYLIF